MSKYTTGELAKLCEVSVRTVQFYDTKGLLKPTELTEGGRRLYSDDDLKKLRLICVLKSLGLSLNSIKGILDSDTSSKVLLLLLDEKLNQLGDEIKDRKNQIRIIEAIKNNIRNTDTISVNSIIDIEHMMKNKNKLRKTYVTMTVICIIMITVQIWLSTFWFTIGVWLPYAMGFPVIILIEILMTGMYYNNAVYVCAECNTKFRPTFRKFIFSGYRSKTKYTPKTRKLSCPKCGNTGYCVETSAEEG